MKKALIFLLLAALSPYAIISASAGLHDVRPTGLFNCLAYNALEKAVTAQMVFHVEYGRYCDDLELFFERYIGKLPNGVTLKVLAVSGQNYLMEAHHVKGDKTYHAEGPEGTIREGQVTSLPAWAKKGKKSKTPQTAEIPKSKEIGDGEKNQPDKQPILLEEMKKEFEKAMKQQEHEKHRKALLELARSGNVFAAARMIDLLMFEEMRDLPPESFSALQYQNIKIGSMTAKQVIGIALANWCERNTKDRQIMLKARELIAADPAAHHTVCSELVWLFQKVEPENRERAEQFLKRGEDLLTEKLGRLKHPSKDLLFDTALLTSSAEIAMSRKEWIRAIELYGQSAQLYGEAGDKKGQGNSLLCKAGCMIQWNAANHTSETRAIFTEAATLSRQGGMRKVPRKASNGHARTEKRCLLAGLF